MRRRAVLAGIAGATATVLAQQLQVLARREDDSGNPVAPSLPLPPDSQLATTPSAPAAAPPAKPTATKPDLSDPKYSPNVFPPAKKTVDGPPRQGEFALTGDDL